VPSLPQVSRSGPGAQMALATGAPAVSAFSGKTGSSGARSFGGASGIGFGAPGTGSGFGYGSRPGGLPISVANPVGYGSEMTSSRSKLYGALVVVLLVVAIGLLTYAVFFAGKHTIKVGRAPTAQPAACYSISPFL